MIFVTINSRSQIENQISDYSLLGASSIFFAKRSNPLNGQQVSNCKTFYIFHPILMGFFFCKMFISMVYWSAIEKYTILFWKRFKVTQITKFLMFGGYIEFTFPIQYWCRFSFELYRKFPVVCRRISYGFEKGLEET
jgi:hypothetical protein